MLGLLVMLVVGIIDIVLGHIGIGIFLVAGSIITGFFVILDFKKTIDKQ